MGNFMYDLINVSKGKMCICLGQGLDGIFYFVSPSQKDDICA